MWRHPASALEWICKACWNNLRELPTEARIFPEVAGESPKIHDGQEVYHLGSPLARQILRPLAELCLSWSGKAATQEPAEQFKRELSWGILEAVSTIEDTGIEILMPELENYRVGVLWENRDVGRTVGILMQSIRVMLGSETQFLFGTRGGPAFKQMVPTISDWESFCGALMYTYGCDMRYLDAGDRGVLPDWPDWFSGLDNYLEVPEREYPAEAAALLEEAYYQQHFTLHPAGATVKLRGFGIITGLTLKTKPGLFDPNYIDFIATFEVDVRNLPGSRIPTTTGRTTVCIDGRLARGDNIYIDINNETSNAYPVKYLQWLAALIYHDLVTAREIDVAPSGTKPSQIPGVSPPDRPRQSWVYIPRKVRGEYVHPRVQSANPRIRDPHHVSGHPRRGHMTERHRQAIILFEKETGLHILDRLPEGRTYVRPHVSPAGEALDRLPRFIHARLQADIDRLLRELPNGTAN